LNEEIVARLGMDTTPFAQGIRTSKTKITEFAAEMKNQLSDAFSGIGGYIASFAALDGIKKLAEFGTNIGKNAKELGASVSFVQGFSGAVRNAGGNAEQATNAMEKLNAKIGEARSGSRTAQEAFEKWGIAIDNADGSGKSLDEIMGEISDKMHMSGSASANAATALDLFGKSGKEVINVLSDGSTALQKHIDDVSKLSDSDVKALSSLDEQIKQSENTLEVWAAKAVDVIAVNAQIIGAMSTGLSFKEAVAQVRQSRADDAKKAAIPGTEKTSDLKERAELEKKAAELQEQARIKAETSLQRVAELEKKRDDLADSIRSKDPHGIEVLQMRVEYQKTLLDLQEAEHKAADDKAEADRKALDAAQKKVDMQDDLNKLESRRNEIIRHQGEEAGDPYKSTIEQLARSGHIIGYGTSNQRYVESPFAGTARQVLGLENEARNAFAYGNKDLGDADVTRIKQLKAGLAAAGAISSDNRLESMDDSLGRLDDNIKALLDKATKDGININPKMAK
jgi:hypothetical protein